MAPPPIVTGLSPNEGPPGTRIKIRGENFGLHPSDLIGLTICGFDCLLSAEWKSPTKIIAMSGPVKGKGEVIVTTRNGGVGTCNVTFKGYHETIGPMKESAVWIEEAPHAYYAWGRHSMLSASNYQQEDPLGLSVEGNEKKFSEDDLMVYFPDKFGDISATNFAPGWFLLENHHMTSFNDLEAGLLHLKRKVQGQKEGTLSFLKANIGSVIDQVDTLTNLKARYEKDLPVFGQEPTRKLAHFIKESEREGTRLFADVLTRRDRAEKTRNALNVLARFRFLFGLPCVIDRNIKKGDYDIVINDYIRVKNLFSKTEVPIFKAALNEIEKRIDELQIKLNEELQTMPISVERQKRLIRYLVNLNASSDPAWNAIQSHSNYIEEKIRMIYDFYKEQNKNEKNTKSAKNKYTPILLDNNSIPSNISFIDEVCTNLAETFPDLWKIGQAYFSGELTVKIESGRQVEFKHMVMNIIRNFCKRIRATIIPNSLDKTDRNSLGNWQICENDMIYLPEILQSMNSTSTILIKLDLPNEVLDMINSLLTDLRIHCMSVSLKQTIEQIKTLQEDWVINLGEDHSGITALPLNFEKSIHDAIQIIKESMEHRSNLLTEILAARNELNKQLENIFNAFHNYLNNLSSNEDGDDDLDNSPVVSQLIGTTMNGYKNSYTDSNLPLYEHRLLITLSNCLYTKDVVLANILRKFEDTGLAVPDVPVKNAQEKLDNLEKIILEKYLEQKSDPLVGTIEPSMYLGRFDWDIDAPPTSIRPYVKECINNLIHVHSEVNSISPLLVDNILSQIVTTIAEELYRLMSCVQKFSVEGAQQARVDINALQLFFQKYTSPKANSYFESALEIIPQLEPLQLTTLEDILSQSRARMRIQLTCLTCKTDNNAQTRKFKFERL